MKSIVIVLLFIIYSSVVSGGRGVDIIKNSPAVFLFDNNFTKDGLTTQPIFSKPKSRYLPFVFLSGILFAGIVILKKLTPAMNAIETQP